MENPGILSPFPASQTASSAAKMLSRPVSDIKVSPLAGDAGNRFYHRITTGDGGAYILSQDSSAAQQTAFVRLQKLFSHAGVTVPAIVRSENNLLLLEDFGDTTYLKALPANADKLYTAAIQTLLIIQQNIQLRDALPLYSEHLLRSEMALFSDWYCARYLQRPLTSTAAQVMENIQQLIINTMLPLPAVAVHRDYHSRNLMVLAAARTPGVLDFQDAVAGCALYDVVSLLRDAYIQWPVQQQQRWLRDYWQEAHRGGKIAAAESYEQCWELFNIIGAQRGLKVLGIFSRLAARDNKPHYLADLPLVHLHLHNACASVPALAPLAAIIADYPPPPAAAT